MCAIDTATLLFPAPVSATRLRALKSGYFQNTKNSPTCAIYNNSNIEFQLNISVIKVLEKNLID